MSDVREVSTLSDESLELLNQLVQMQTGIVLGDSNKTIVQNKILSRMKHLGIAGFHTYYDLLKTNNQDEINYLLNASTINFTSFMREKDSFQFLTDRILPEVIQQNSNTKKIRIWSSACSTGEEAYTLAIVLKEALQATPEWDVKIIATDIDTDALAVASQGVYPRNRISVFNEIRQRKWFPSLDQEPDMVRVHPDLRKMVEFKRINLNSNWALPESMDLIFCRNVLIYFDTLTRMALIKKFSKSLVDYGWLIIGRSESIYGYSDDFVAQASSIFQLKSS